MQNKAANREAFQVFQSDRAAGRSWEPPPKKKVETRKRLEEVLHELELQQLENPANDYPQ
jgi:hypothetical protein